MFEQCTPSLDNFAAEVSQLEHELQSCCWEAKLERYNSEINVRLSQQKAELIKQEQKDWGIVNGETATTSILLLRSQVGKI